VTRAARGESVLAYSRIIGQAQLKCALELSYIEPRISGVLVSGERGTGKSTTVRAFAQMVTGRLPVTLPINATEDRVVGGGHVGELLKSKPKWKTGLLEAANQGMLYIDEVNLLDDHIVNIILDVTASGILTVERDSQVHKKRVRFSLVGTMNPEEGTLRPQLLDRFGLMVDVRGLSDIEQRRKVLATVLAADDPRESTKGRRDDESRKTQLDLARAAVPKLALSPALLEQCVDLARDFGADGHRGDYTLALAARALAANKDKKSVTTEHLIEVAPLVLQHRRRVAGQREFVAWTAEDDTAVEKALGRGGA
jgi:magnesium chelatase subunit I